MCRWSFDGEAEKPDTFVLVLVLVLENRVAQFYAARRVAKLYADSGQDVTAFLLRADAFHQSGLDQRAQQIQRALFRDAQRGPDFARRHAFVIAEQLQQLLLFQRWAIVLAFSL